MKLAADSPFAGERENALAAAERLAARKGMSLEEVASGGRRQGPRAETFEEERTAHRHQTRPPSYMDAIDYHIYLEKARREKAMQAAMARGLDSDDDRRHGRGSTPPFRSRRTRDPWSHARTLLSETSLPLSEVVDITGLDIYQVAGLKLKMRN